MISELVTTRHLSRKAVVYIRQSHPHQVLSNQESLRLQYGLCQRARDFGWQDSDVEVVDADLGLSGAAADHRRGFKDLIARVTLGEVGIILSYDVTRLARSCSDWYSLLDLCGFRQLIADRDGVYDRTGVYTALDQRHPDARVILPPRADAVLSATADTEPTKRDCHIQAIAGKGRLAWQRDSGYNERARVEGQFARCKQVIGGGQRFHSDETRAVEVAIAA